MTTGHKRERLFREFTNTRKAPKEWRAFAFALSKMEEREIDKRYKIMAKARRKAILADVLHKLDGYIASLMMRMHVE